MAEVTLFQVGVLFAAAAVAGVAADRIGQSVIPLYILVGMALGPFVLGRLPDVLPPLEVAGMDVVGSVSAIAVDGTTGFVVLGAEIGIVLLLFFLGLEFNIERLLESRQRIGAAGTIDLANFVVGFGLGWVLFGGVLAAVFVAGIVYISSSAIITKSLLDLGWIANDEADPILGILVYEDLFIAIYLAIITAIATGSGGVSEALTSVAVGMGFIVALLALVTLGEPIFDRLLAGASHEFTVIRTLGLTVLIAGVALSLGVSEAVAAFFVGMGFASTDHVHDLERLLEPVRDTFAALFFLWIGLLTDPASFGPVVGLIAIAVVVTTASKLVTAYWGGRVYDLSERRSVRVALGMTTRGEFSLIIASIALTAGANGVVPAGVADELYALAVGYVLAMSILGTTLMGYADRIEGIVVPRLEARST
ncbi:Kef-type K+ transport system, membrane component [Halovivax ruber XH-70]|uniref:Kef-type K+ transport system, membrane component n=1 Tax=Halovivax ruber (strain DSM 18193 / JCM 13892 / XH-70) TaxID=797302 RepID=L0IEM9_HALRX|nr:cation:proton antiporter [Halovivax ruber]AGB16681.1 Kef-type K+ transport system, membrane component [Halovivax ruber XH-70]